MALRGLCGLAPATSSPSPPSSLPFIGELYNHPGLLVVHQEGQAGSHLRASALAFSSPGPFFLMARSPLDSLPHTIQVSAQMALCQLDTAHPLFFVLHRTQVLCPPHSLSPHHASFSLRVLITAKQYIFIYYQLFLWIVNSLMLGCLFHLFPCPQYLN